MHYKYLGLLVGLLGLYLKSHTMERDLCKPTFPVEQQARTAWIESVIRPLIKNSIVEQMYEDTVSSNDKVTKAFGTFAHKVLKTNTYTPKIDLVKPDAYIQEAKDRDWYFFSNPTLCQFDENSWNNFIDAIRQTCQCLEWNNTTNKYEFTIRTVKAYCVGQSVDNSHIYTQCLIKKIPDHKNIYQKDVWPVCKWTDKKLLLDRVLKNIVTNLQSTGLDCSKFLNPYDPWELLEIIQQELLTAQIIDERVDLVYLAYYFYPIINTFGSLENIHAYLDKHAHNNTKLRYGLWRKLLLVGAQTNKHAVFQLFFEQPNIQKEFQALDNHILWSTDQTLCARYSSLYSLLDPLFVTEDIDNIINIFYMKDGTFAAVSCGIYDLLLCAMKFNSTTIVEYFTQSLVNNRQLNAYWNETPYRARMILRQLLVHCIKANNTKIVHLLFNLIAPEQPWFMYRDIITEINLSDLNSTYVWLITTPRASQLECQKFQVPHPLFHNNHINQAYTDCIWYMLALDYSQILKNYEMYFSLRVYIKDFDYYVSRDNLRDENESQKEMSNSQAMGSLLVDFFKRASKKYPNNTDLQALLSHLGSGLSELKFK